jgi:hypothetical protein
MSKHNLFIHLQIYQIFEKKISLICEIREIKFNNQNEFHLKVIQLQQ